MKPTAIFLLLSTLALLLSGCAGTPETTMPDRSQTPATTSSVSIPSPPPPPIPQFVSEENVGGILWVIDRPAENRTVQIRHVGGAQQVQSCRNLITPPGNHAWFHYVVWNRTGLASYHEFSVNEADLHKPFNVSFELPADPPFMFQTSFCSIWTFVEFHAFSWTSKTIQSTPNVSSDERIQYDINIPGGALSGSGSFGMEYPYHYMIQGALPGLVNPQQGMQYGDWYMYAPGDTGDDWLLHGWHHVDDSGWESQRLIHHAEPGPYSVRIDLTAPSALKTVWGIEHTVFRFNDRLADHGFALPLERYV